MADLKGESETWQRAYSEDQLVARRLKKHWSKLQGMGIEQWARKDRLLDVCCGTGEVLGLLRKHGFSDLYGMDVTPPSTSGLEGVDIRRGDARALPYDDESFDVVLCMHALHHLGGPDGVKQSLAEMIRVLRPGGRLALIDHYDSMQLRLAFWLCRQPWFAWASQGLRSFRQQLLEEHDYLYEYLDKWPTIREFIDRLPVKAVELDRKDRFFFYWIGTKSGEK